MFPKPTRKSRKDRAAARREARTQRLSLLHESVKARCAGWCELCRLDRAGELHHILGGGGRRRRQEREDTLIALCIGCHAALHSNKPRTLERLKLWAQSRGARDSFLEASRRLAKVYAHDLSRLSKENPRR